MGPLTQQLRCDADQCIREALAQIFNPNLPIADRIQVAAAATVITCGTLTPEQQHECASRLFDVAPESTLAKAFVFAYQIERNILHRQNELKCGSALTREEGLNEARELNCNSATI